MIVAGHEFGRTSAPASRATLWETTVLVYGQKGGLYAAA
jgi:hypothetical protein